MKFELIVVDDEDMALEGLRAFPWREYGFQLVSCFQDPTEVIGWLKSHTVQLIVADVRMPGMSGLELTKKVHELFPDIAVVLLSGHSEFSYAQKALKYGVLRYVLKPIDDEEFGAVLHEIHHFLEKREDKKKWNHSVLREYSINRLLEHKTDDIVLQSSPMDELKKFRVALVRQKTGNLKVSMHGYEDLIFHSLHTTKDESAWIVEEKNIADLKNRLTEAEKILAFSAVHNAKEELSSALNEAREATAFFFCSLKHTHVFYENLPVIDQLTVNQFFDKSSQLADRIVRFEVDDQLNELDLLFAEVKESLLPEHYVKQCAFIIAIGIQRVVTRWINLEEEEMIDKGKNPFQLIDESRNIEEIENLFIPSVKKIFFEVLENKGELEKNKKLESVLYFIDQHYHEMISMDDVAECAGMHPARFSVWFKNNKGENYIDYITRLRINTAKELLARENNILIKDVAQSVGYPDSRYFSQVFRRIVGVTPRVYQKNHSIE